MITIIGLFINEVSLCLLRRSQCTNPPNTNGYAAFSLQNVEGL